MRNDFRATMVELRRHVYAPEFSIMVLGSMDLGNWSCVQISAEVGASGGKFVLVQ